MPDLGRAFTALIYLVIFIVVLIVLFKLLAYL